jgi:hypothetical protein
MFTQKTKNLIFFLVLNLSTKNNYPSKTNLITLLFLGDSVALQEDSFAPWYDSRVD